jgi:hypothetical protein
VILFAKVEDVFRITNRGLVVQFGGMGPEARARVKDPIQLRTPDGQVFDTHVVGIEHMRGLKGQSHWSLRFPPDITEQHVPRGTEIWIARSD